MKIYGISEKYEGIVGDAFYATREAAQATLEALVREHNEFWETTRFSEADVCGIVEYELIGGKAE